MKRYHPAVLATTLLVLALAGCAGAATPEPPQAAEGVAEQAAAPATATPAATAPAAATAAPTAHAQVKMTSLRAERQAVLSQIAAIPEGKLLVGQWGLFGEGNTPESADEVLNEIYAQTGRYPAMTGADFGALSASKQQVTDWLIAKHREGYIVAASYHMENPVTGGWVDDTDLDGQTLCDIPSNPQYQADVDELAGYLQQLEDAGVVLLWRPFHEMNGGWFWWGFENHDGCFDDLWQDLHRRLVRRHGLSNLLWVYSPNAPFGDASREFLMSGYPGDAYVDIVGLDKYGAWYDEELDLDEGYEALVETGKPFMLNEFGGRDTNPREISAPYALQDRLLADLEERYPEVKGVMFWEWVWGLDSDDYAQQEAFMNDSAVLARSHGSWELALSR